MTILELSGIKPSILPITPDNSSLTATINNAFSSGEAIHYKDIKAEDYTYVSPKMMSLLAIAQQLKDKNVEGVEQLEKRIIFLIENNFDIVEKDGKVIITNGLVTLDCKLPVNETAIFKDYKMNEELLSIDELYNITGGSIDYQKAKKTINFCYSLALSKRETYDYSAICSTIMESDKFTDSIIDNTYSIKSEIIDRGNKKGYKLCESVNIGMDNTNNSFYNHNDQRKIIDSIINLDSKDLDAILNSQGLLFRKTVIDMIPKNDYISKEEFYAKAIVDSLTPKLLIKYAVRDEFTKEEKDRLYKDLSKYNLNKIYNSFNRLNLTHEEISAYILNLFLENSYKGYSFEELCELEDLDKFIEDNISKLNKESNPITLNRYFGIENDVNYVPNSSINLRDYQLRIKHRVDDIYSSDRRFAGVVLPTGAGKSFVAMAELLERKDENIVYIAPRLGILRQFKKHIVKYIAGIDPKGLSDDELTKIVKDCFPHLELCTYQGLDPENEAKLKKYDADFIILDEIHHVGADKWNPAIRVLLKRNKKAKVLGMTATPVRDDNPKLSVEDRDMMRLMADTLDDYTNQELNEKRYLAADISIIDAIQEGYVVQPKIVSFDYNLDELPEYKEAQRVAAKETNKYTKEILNDKLIKLQNIIKDAEIRGADKIIKNFVQDEKGRYILFLPRKKPGEDKEDITTEEYLNNEIEKFKADLALVDKNPIVETIYSGKGKKENEAAIKNFESDDNPNHIKILVAIDMLNEGVHLEEIKGSFNYRKIKSDQMILLLQHLGRTVFALDPNKPLDEKDIPVVFDRFNNYSNLKMDRIVNKTDSSSDLEKMRDVEFWVEKYGYIPDTGTINDKEKKKAIRLQKIQQKYKYYLNLNLDDVLLSSKEKYEIEEILRIGKKIGLWEIEFEKVPREIAHKIDHVNIFDVSATQREFLDICHSIQETVERKEINKTKRIKDALTVLDFLSENKLTLNPNTIKKDTKLEDFLKKLNEDIREEVLFELNKRGINEKYPLGEEYIFTREQFYRGYHGVFSDMEATPEDVIDLRRYGILYNTPDMDIIDNRGFIIEGSWNFVRKNIWTGTYYDENGYSIGGTDKHGFYEYGLHNETKEMYDNHGFDKQGIHKITKTEYDEYGFNIDGIHKITGTIVNEEGFNIDHYWFDKNADGSYDKRGMTSSKYNRNTGYNIDGYDRRGFDRNGINKDTGKLYDYFYYDQNGYYWKLKPDGTREPTKSRINENSHDCYGNYWVKDENGKLINKGKTYNQYGFFADGTHYMTKTKWDPRGFDINGYWYYKDDDENMVPSGSKFNKNGWNIEGQTIRHNIYGGEFLDSVDDHGFDEDGIYHNPINPETKKNYPIDSNGLKVLVGGTLYYSNRKKRYINKRYDIHGFNYLGIHRLTGTKLNPNNFDINGFWYKKDENGVLVNTGKLTDDLGWTIDKRMPIKDENGNFQYVDRYNGFDADKKHKNGTYFDDNNFDVYGINKHTQTNLDLDGFDVDGYYYKFDKNLGKTVNTNQKYNESGWRRDHTYLDTGSRRDKHGFNYLHQFIHKNGNYELYDNHGFDYTGIHKTTGTRLNAKHFDIDGYWYKKVDGRYVTTGSKYDDEGLNIERLDPYDFSKNGYYKGSRSRYNKEGFDVNHIHSITGKKYNLYGKDIDGNPVPNIPQEEVRRINNIKRLMFESKKQCMETIYDGMTEGTKELLLESFDEIEDEFDETNDFLEDFINKINIFAINSDSKQYTEEEIYEFIREKVREKQEEKKNKELYEMTEMDYSRRYYDGDVPESDYEGFDRFKYI